MKQGGHKGCLGTKRRQPPTRQVVRLLVQLRLWETETPGHLRPARPAPASSCWPPSCGSLAAAAAPLLCAPISMGAGAAPELLGGCQLHGELGGTRAAAAGDRGGSEGRGGVGAVRCAGCGRSASGRRGRGAWGPLLKEAVCAGC